MGFLFFLFRSAVCVIPPHVLPDWMRLTAPGAVLKPDAVMASRARLTAGAHRGFYSPSFILSVLHV